MSTATAETVRISCACKVCKVNAVRVGAPFPLQADIPARLAAVIRKPHTTVHAAHSPSALDAAVRANTGIVAVR